ncbi:MAG: Response regulator ArlR [Parcubacteria bacterium OLB19]|nr:MAG: Response regulator ArlR [Parcubacteria bacterium OLB19]
MLQKTILIIEDSADLAASLVDMLTIKEYKTLTATEGKNGLDIALREHPDLILLDLRLPDISGVQVMSELKKDTWGKKAKVLIITASDVNEKTITDLGVNADDIIHKANSGISDLIKRIEKELN